MAASQVCRAWHEVCQTDELLLRQVALYQGGLTKTAFGGMFAMSVSEVQALPHSVKRHPNGGVYCVFGEEAVSRVVSADPCLMKRRDRLRTNTCGHRQPNQRLLSRPASNQMPRWRLEEMLHQRKRRDTLGHGSVLVCVC